MLLKKNSTGSEVQAWQAFLIDQKFLKGTPSSTFDTATEKATRAFQTAQKLTADGIVGNETRARALALGFAADDSDESTLGIQPDVTPLADKRLVPKDLITQAQKLGLAPAALKAVTDVEARGSGFLTDGRLLILFEGHIFWNELEALGKKPETLVNAATSDILYPKWTKKFYQGGAGEYERLERARSINTAAANRSASWGMYQIMGFNCHAAGFDTAEAMIAAFLTHERVQLKAFASFLKVNNLVNALQTKNWAAFARGYNGPKYAQNEYDKKLARAYSKAVLAAWAG
jgi:hypothetical protein